MVEVNLSSEECNRVIKWYSRLFGADGAKQPDKEDYRIMTKIETMRDAYFLEEEEFRNLTK